jgi:hypothetical protein
MAPLRAGLGPLAHGGQLLLATLTSRGVARIRVAAETPRRSAPSRRTHPQAVGHGVAVDHQHHLPVAWGRSALNPARAPSPQSQRIHARRSPRERCGAPGPQVQYFHIAGPSRQRSCGVRREVEAGARTTRDGPGRRSCAPVTCRDFHRFYGNRRADPV